MIGELALSEMDALLGEEIVGRIGCCADDVVYIVPINYVYDGGSVYGHTGEGMKVRIMRAHPNVCFQVDQIEDIGSWRSVIAWGNYEELTANRLRRDGSLVARLMAVVQPPERNALSPFRVEYPKFVRGPG